MYEQVLLDLGNLPEGLYKVAFSRIGQGQEQTELERTEFHVRKRADGNIELSEDGNWGRFSNQFAAPFRTERYYLQHMKDASSVKPDSRVLDVSEILDTNE